MISIIIIVFKSNKEILNRFLNNIDGNFNLIIVDNSNNYDFLMIHDAARPTFTKNIMIELLSSINSKKYHCAVPASKVEDTIRKNNKSVKRNDYK